MKQIRLNEEEIKNAVKEAIQENYANMFKNRNGQVFEQMRAEISRKQDEISIQIQRLQDKYHLMGYIIPAFMDVDKEIHQMIPDIQGPVRGNYSGSFIYTLANPIAYDEENEYGILSSIEDDIEDMFPKQLRQYVSVYTKDSADYSTRSGFQIDFEIDDL